MPYHSRTLEFDDSNFNELERQLNELQSRFNGMHKILIQHSQAESSLHEKKKGYRDMPIDPSSLNTDYSNKVMIIQDIVDLVESIEEEG